MITPGAAMAREQRRRRGEVARAFLLESVRGLNPNAAAPAVPLHANDATPRLAPRAAVQPACAARARARTTRAASRRDGF
jgi:hypothetical protein